MPTPATGPISMGDVNTETNWTQSMYNFYNFANFGGNGTLQYHNLEMGPSNTQNAKTLIYDPVSIGASGQNLKLENWYNYYQGATGRFNISLFNNCTDNDVLVELYVADLYQSPVTYLRVWGPDNGPGGANTAYNLVLNNGSDFSQTEVDIGVAMTVSNFPSGTYVIFADLSATYYAPPPPPPPGPPTTVSGSGSASDTDGVGAGTTRTLNAGGIVFDAANPVAKVPIVTGNIPGGTGDGIYVNKRTTFSITFTS